MLDDMNSLIRDEVEIQSERLLSECFTFVRNDKGKPEAQEDCHDDTVMAYAIAVEMHSLMPMLGVISEEERKRRETERQKRNKPRSRHTRV
jgi:phage terminase large subunit